MGRIYDAVVEWFREDGWNFQEHPERGFVALGVDGAHANWRCYGQADEELSFFLFYAVAPIKVPEPKRHDVALFLTRVNYQLRIGNFDLDLDDGEVRYKTSVDVEGSEALKPLVRQCVAAALATADRYFPALAGVLYANLTPEEAVAQVDAPPAGS